MKKNSAMLGVVVGLLLGVGAFGADPIGKIATVEGDAVAVSADGKSTALKADSPVYLNDKIVTKANTKVQIRFADNSVISQGEKSEMTVDKYVYNPDNKEQANCSLRLLKGVFRVITGKITELNPERFKVSTKMATIGIRGCELGFRLQGKAEDIYIVEVEAGRKIVIEAMEVVKELAGRILTIERQGITVSLLDGAAMTQRPLTADESTRLIRDSTPQSAGSDSRPVELIKSFRTPAQEAASVVSDAVSKKTTQSLRTLGDGSGGFPAGFTGPTTPPESTTPPKTPPNLVAMGGVPPPKDWSWGIWDDGTMIHAGAFLSSGEFNTIVGAGPRTLVTTPSNSGQAGAYLQEGSSPRKLVTGSCDLTVQLNVSANVHQWSGSFNMQNGSDSLSFTVPVGIGTVDSAGNLHLPAWGGSSSTVSYSMHVNTTTYSGSSISAEGVNGQMVRPVAGASITGVSGNFYFRHNTGARVDGVFGSDLK